MSMIEDVSGSNSTELSCIRELVESLDQIVFLASADLSRIFYISPAYERVTGYTCESVYENPRRWIDQIHEDDRPMVQESVNHRLSGKLQGRTETEYRMVNANGSIRWLRCVITPLSDESGKLDRLVGLLEDITVRKQEELALEEVQTELSGAVLNRTQELSLTISRLEREIDRRKKIEAELRRSELRFRRLFEANIVGVLFSDVYGNIFDANEAFLEMSGYSRSDLPLRWDRMTPPEWTHLSQWAIEQLYRVGRVAPWEKEYYRKDGTRVPVLVGVGLLDRETGQCVSFVINLTRRKAAEEQVRDVSLQLEHAARLSAMGEMLADMTHEIHQPLGVIANYANGSMRRLKAGRLTVGALKDRLREIAAEALRVSEVLRRIREFIRRREPERKPIDLNNLILDALQLTRLEQGKKGVAVIVRPDRGLPPVQADRVQITQVLVNLLLNAVQALSTDGRKAPKILISTFVNDEGMVELCVTDNGPGIPAADLPKIFDRFFTTKPGGLGLGLPISRSIMEAHGGKLWCDSPPGESATFHLTLPASRQSTGQKHNSSPESTVEAQQNPR